MSDTSFYFPVNYFPKEIKRRIVSVYKELRNRKEERETVRDWGMACFNYCEALDFSQRETGTSPQTPETWLSRLLPLSFFPFSLFSFSFCPFYIRKKNEGMCIRQYKWKLNYKNDDDKWIYEPKTCFRGSYLTSQLLSLTFMSSEIINSHWKWMTSCCFVVNLSMNGP